MAEFANVWSVFGLEFVKLILNEFDFAKLVFVKSVLEWINVWIVQWKSLLDI